MAYRIPRGAAVVELALVAPFFMLILLGIVEFGRGLMVQQMLINASREGARLAALPDSTTSSVKSAVTDFLSTSSIHISTNNVTVTPDPATAVNSEQITVSVQVPFAEVSWLPGSHLSSATLRASTKMRSERFE